jgi:inorganic pyrophosphatase
VRFQIFIGINDDPLDVVVIMEDELLPGCFIKCKFLGVLETQDDAGIDPKIIMCPCKNVDPTYNEFTPLHIS